MTAEQYLKKLQRAKAIATRCNEAGVQPPTWVRQLLRL